MNRIEIRGVIVPSIYDTEWSQKYIDKGIITPESTFRNALKKCDPKEPLDIYINSPGGSVFSAYEIVNAVKEWKVQNKQPANIIIGAMAASAASMIAVFVGSSVKAHKNAKMMFHGASAETYGGQGAHKDSVELLGKINAEVQQVLIQKYKMSPDLVAEWFAEGRMGWLTAEEMIKAGIASEIIPDDADAIDFNDAEIKAIDEQGLDIAACFEKPPEVKKDGIGKSPEGSAINPEIKPDAGADPKDGGSGLQTADEALKAADLAGYARAQTEIEIAHAKELDGFAVQLAARDELIAKHQSVKDKAEARILALTNEHVVEISKLIEAHDKHIAELEKLSASASVSARAQITDLTKCLKDANDRNSKLLGGGMAFEPAGPDTWEDAMQTCKGDYAEAAKKYPKLIGEYNARMRNKRK